MTDSDLSREQASAILAALRALLNQDAEGQVLLAHFEADPIGTADALAVWLRKHFNRMPLQLATYVSGGQVEKLVNIAQAGVVLIQPALPPQHEISSIWHVPYRRNPFFTGREELLKRLHDNFTTTRAMALTQAQAISGLGGIGKTQIAVEYAYRYREQYRAVLWLRTATSSDLLADFVTVAQVLNLPVKDEPDQHRIADVVKRWLEEHDEWFLIFDNADDLAIVAPFLPRSTHGHILLTTRVQATGTIARALEVEKMNLDEGVLLLLRRAKRLEPDALQGQALLQHRVEAEAIVRELDGLPLALDQAGAYIEEKQCSLTTYLTLYRTHRKKLLHRRSTMPSDHPEPVATTWKLSFQSVEQANPAFADLLRLCAFLDPDAIPDKLLMKGASELGPVLGPVVADIYQWNEAIEGLLKYSLVRRNADAQVFSVHRLVQAVLKDEMDEATQRQWIERCIRHLNQVFPSGTMIVEQWEWCEQLVPHVLMCAAPGPEWEPRLPETASLFHKTAAYFDDRAQYEAAERLYQRALSIYEQVMEPNHSSISQTLSDLAYLYVQRGKYKQGQSLYQRALRIREEALGPDHPLVAAALNGLAIIYYNQGKYEQAESLYQRALRIREEALGPNHSHVATSLNNLAVLYWEQSKYEQAEPLYQRALHIREQVLGPNHPQVATSLHNLASLYSDQGKYEQAEPLYQRALHIREQVLGPNHPYVATSLSNLASLYRNQGKYEQAEPLYQHALHIREQALEPDHPSMAASLHNLANLYFDQGKYEQAEPLYQRALRIREQVLEPGHHSVAASLHNLANLYRNQGKYEQAEPLYQRALTIREQGLGSQHPETAESLHDLAIFHHDQGHVAVAEALYQRALATREQILGLQHPGTRATLNRYATLLRTANRTDEAATLEARLTENRDNG